MATSPKTKNRIKYLEYIENSAIPYIETNYRVDSADRTLTGASASGLFGTWVLLNKPELFKNYILLSPNYRYDNKVILKKEENYFRKNKDLNANVYIATGSLENIPYMRHNMISEMYEFAVQLESRKYKSLQLEYELIENSIHGTSGQLGLLKGIFHFFFNK